MAQERHQANTDQGPQGLSGESPLTSLIQAAAELDFTSQRTAGRSFFGGTLNRLESAARFLQGFSKEGSRREAVQQIGQLLANQVTSPVRNLGGLLGLASEDKDVVLGRRKLSRREAFKWSAGTAVKVVGALGLAGAALEACASPRPRVQTWQEWEATHPLLDGSVIPHDNPANGATREHYVNGGRIFKSLDDFKAWASGSKEWKQSWLGIGVNPETVSLVALATYRGSERILAEHFPNIPREVLASRFGKAGQTFKMAYRKDDGMLGWFEGKWVDGKTNEKTNEYSVDEPVVLGITGKHLGDGAEPTPICARVTCGNPTIPQAPKPQPSPTAKPAPGPEQPKQPEQPEQPKPPTPPAPPAPPGTPTGAPFNPPGEPTPGQPSATASPIAPRTPVQTPTAIRQVSPSPSRVVPSPTTPPWNSPGEPTPGQPSATASPIAPRTPTVKPTAIGTPRSGSTSGGSGTPGVPTAPAGGF